MGYNRRKRLRVAEQTEGQPMQDALQIARLTQEFAEMRSSLATLHDVSFAVEDGSWTSCLGVSGCGKTTLLRVLAGLLEPTGGHVEFMSRKPRSSLIAYLPQHDTLLPWRTAIDNVLLPAELDGRSLDAARKEALDLFQRVGLAGFEAYYPTRLSGGMRQRVALIRTFLAHREILLLDEPLGALDPLTRMKLQDWLLEVWGAFRKTVILVTHDVEEAVVLSDRIVVLSERPASVRRVIDVALQRPRVRDGIEAVRMKREILSLLMNEVEDA